MSDQNTETLLAQLAVKIENIVDTVNEIKGFVREGMRQASDLTLRIGRLEDRLSNHESAHAKLASDHADLDKRIQTLEGQQPVTQQTQTWVQTAVWAAVVLVGIFAAKKVGLM